MNRERWLTECIRLLREDFTRIGFPLPERIRASCSWPSKSALAKRNRRIGELWSAEASADQTFEAFISPAIKDSVQVGATLVHELVHSVVGLARGHKQAFRRCALLIGLTGPMTATTAGEGLAVRLAEITDTLGPYPHAELVHSNAPKKQTTRMLKVVCLDCECVVRMTRKWLDEVGPPTCACGGEMMEDGGGDGD